MPTFAPTALIMSRLRAGLSRPELAELSKVSDETIRRAELGMVVPRPGTVHALAAALGINTDTLYRTEVAA